MTWTGRQGEPVPVALRHTLREAYTEGPGGVALWVCDGCDASGLMVAGVEPDWLPTTLCPAAVSQRDIARIPEQIAALKGDIEASRALVCGAE